MPENRSGPNSTLALNTKVEQDFVSPLTAVRGSLEILRDFPDLAKDDRSRFVRIALNGCERLERGVEQLSKSVYAAGDRKPNDPEHGPTPKAFSEYGIRVTLVEDQDIAEIDMSDLTFNSSMMVNDFYDVVDWIIELSGRSWFVLVNVAGCSIWPEAWVAFAHRGKKISASYSRGTVRYAEQAGQSETSDPEIMPSRDAAIRRIESLKIEY